MFNSKAVFSGRLPDLFMGSRDSSAPRFARRRSPWRLPEILETRVMLAGDLDVSFGTAGKVLTPITTNSDEGRAVAIQADGKILVAGTAGVAGNGVNDVAVVRYLSNGSLDTSFGTDGKALVPPGLLTNSEKVSGIAVDSSGRILVAGSAYDGTKFNFLVARFLSNGVLDTSFDENGLQSISFGSLDSAANAVLVQADGKILLGGVATVSGPTVFAATRLNDNGSIDTSYGNSGKVTTSAPGGSAAINGMALQADGKLVAVGRTINGGNNDFAIARYTTAGLLDTSFDGDGLANIGFGTADDIGFSVVVQSDGKIVVGGGGTATGNTDLDFALARLNSNGSLDSSFGSGGKVTTDLRSIHGYDAIFSLQLAADGKLVAGGYATLSIDSDFAVARYNSNGTLDTTFSGDGKETVDFGSNNDVAYGLGVHADGSVVLGGRSGSINNTDFAVARLSGAPLASFALSTKTLLNNLNFGIVATDLDGDTNPDIAVLDNYGYLNTYIGTGSGTFSGGDLVHTGVLTPDPYSLAAGQISGSNLPELVVGSFGSMGVRVMANSGGAFSESSFFNAGGNVSGVAVGDVNGDGFNDIVAARYNLSSVTIFYLNGNGSLINTETHSTGNGPKEVILTDVDNNGSLDIVTANSLSNTFSVLKHVGGGLNVSSFASGGTTPIAIQAGDFSGDGFVDLMVVNSGSTQVTYARNTGGGNFVTQQVIATVSEPRGLTSLDFDRDGLLDLAVAGKNSGKVQIFRNTGGSFQSNTSFSAASPFEIVSADFNTDGRADLLASSADSESVKVLLGTTNSAPTDVVLSNTNVAENLSAGTVVGTLNAVDENPLDSQTFSLVSGAGATDNALFSLVGNELRTTVAFDYETQSTYSIRLRSSDPYSGTFEKAVTILVNDVNEAVDTSFGTNGIYRVDLGTVSEGASRTVVQPDGKLVTAGAARSAGNWDFVVARFLPDGGLDTSFGDGGKKTIDFGIGDDFAESLVLQADGKILVVGEMSNGSNNDVALVRLTDSGQLDSSFGTGGKVSTGFGAGHENGRELALGPGGVIYVAGDTVQSNSDMMILKYDASGVLVSSFGTSGKLAIDFGSVDSANAIAVQSNGNVVVSGFRHNGSDFDFAMARVSGTTGQVDSNFGTSGKFSFPVGTGADYSNSMVMLTNESFVLAGLSTAGTKDNFAIAKVTANGQLDNSFGTSGKTTVSVGVGNDRAQSITVQPDGKLLVAGLTTTGSNLDMAIVRFSTAGVLDSSFDGDGRQTIAVMPQDDVAYAVTMQGIYKAVLTGISNNGSKTATTLVRIVTADNSAPTDISLSANAVAENQSVGTTVGTFSSTDLNAGETFTYSFVSGSSPDNASFQIVGNELRTNAVLDFEQKATYSIRVRASDQGGLTFDKQFAISVTDLDDTFAMVSATSFLTSGTLAANSTVLTVSFNEPVSFSFGSQERPAVSAQQIKTVNPTAADGIYWIDPDGAGAIAPFQVYCDMTTDGGGWMLAVNSVIGAEPASNDIVANTGTVGLTTAHTRNLNSYFAGTATAEIRHDIDGSNVGLGRFHGKYTADSYQSVFTSVTTLASHSNSALLQGSFGASFGGNPGGLSWFYSGNPQTTIPASPLIGSPGPFFLQFGLTLNSQRIWIRGGTSATGPSVGGAELSNNYELRRAGSDGLLGNTDDPIVNISEVTTSGNTATLNFVALPEDVYRLTVKDSITNGAGNALDGDGNGAAGGNWVRDFVVDAVQNGLDVSFDIDGKLTTALGLSHDEASSVVIQSDGKLLVAGSSFNGNNYDFALARYNVDGSLDPSFDGDGKVTTAIGASNDTAASVTIQSDGKIIVAGRSNNGSYYEFAMVRYNINGSLDTTFDGDGKVTTTFFTIENEAASVVVQNDGNIVVAGYSHSGPNRDYALARYRTNGSLDTAFDGDGKLTTDFSGSHDIATSMAVQNDGRIIVAGYSSNGANDDFALARYNINGSLDTTFDGDGKLTTAFGSSFDVARSLAIQDDGKIIVAGYSSNGSNFDVALARYHVTGLLDTSFDGDGKLTSDFHGSNDFAASVAVQSDGKIVAAAQAFNGNDYDFALLRYNSNGLLDTSFENDGKLTTDFNSGSNDIANSVALQSDGKITAVGYTSIGGANDFAVARYSANGTLSRVSPNGSIIEIDRDSSGIGQLLQGSNNAFDGLNRLRVGSINFSAPMGISGSSDDSEQTFVSTVTAMSGLDTYREVTVPNAISQNFARTQEVFTNNTVNSITTTVSMVGNLGSDAATTVFATSDGDLQVEPTDLWFGTDDADGTGTPAIIHLLHGPFGLQPTSVNVIEDNVEWTYNLTVAAGETKRLASFTVLGTTRADAIAAANALVTTNGFGGEAAAFLTTDELASLANFQFNTAPTDIALSANSVAENNVVGAVVGTLSTVDSNLVDGDTFSYSLVAGTGSEDNAAFTIVGNQLQTASVFDFETKNSYSIRVRSTDQGGLATEKIFNITVSDVVEDFTPPTSSVTGATLNVGSGSYDAQVTFSDPAGPAGVAASGVQFVDVYYRVNPNSGSSVVRLHGRASTSAATSGTATVSAPIIVQPGDILQFWSVATDAVGNLESEVTPRTDYSMVVTDTVGPTTQVNSAVFDGDGFVNLTYSGTDVGGGNVASIDIYVETDPGTGSSSISKISTVSGGANSVSGSLRYALPRDGVSHSYRFFSIGTDHLGNREGGSGPLSGDPGAGGDVLLNNITVAAPVSPQVIGFDVNGGLANRSSVTAADLLFNDQNFIDDLLSSLNDGNGTNDRVVLERLDLAGNPIGGGQFVPVTAIRDGQKMVLNFGATGLQQNGVYAIRVDLDGNLANGYENARTFHRLLGDTNGDGRVDVADSNKTRAAYANPALHREGDVDGDGDVDSSDINFFTKFLRSTTGDKKLTILRSLLDD